MARVVQAQRSGPPYLLILFVFLFLVATVVAVLLYLDDDKAITGREKAQKELNGIVSPRERDTAAFNEMLNGGKQNNLTVYSQLQQKLDRDTQIITGSTDSQGAVEPLAEGAYKVIGSRPGLAPAVTEAYAKIADLKDQIKKMEDDVAAKKADLEAKDKQVAEIGAAAEKTKNESTAKIAELDAKLEAVQKEREKSEADLNTGKQKEVEGLNKQIAEKGNQILSLQKKLKDVQDELNIVKAHTGGPTYQDQKGPTANGVVVKAPEGDTIYINLGEADRIHPGIPFNVYPRSGITAEANNWIAKIVVQTVGKYSSACRVTQLTDKSNPIVPDDLIYNVAYNRARNLKFVVAGLFDIYSEHAASAQGADDVKGLIQRFGGTVENEVTTDTDFVVLGQEPAGAKAPAEGTTAAPASPEDEKAKDAYIKARTAAETYKIPVLNVNRFLDLSGFYSPESEK